MHRTTQVTKKKRSTAEEKFPKEYKLLQETLGLDFKLESLQKVVDYGVADFLAQFFDFVGSAPPIVDMLAQFDVLKKQRDVLEEEWHIHNNKIDELEKEQMALCGQEQREKPLLDAGIKPHGQCYGDDLKRFIVLSFLHHVKPNPPKPISKMVGKERRAHLEKVSNEVETLKKQVADLLVITEGWGKA